MKFFYFLLTTLSLCTVSFAQSLEKNKIDLPTSIYTSHLSVETNTLYTSLNKRLNIGVTKLFYKDVRKSKFTTPVSLSDEISSIVIEDDYKEYRDENLLKGFLQKHDPTQWSICNFLPQNMAND